MGMAGRYIHGCFKIIKVVLVKQASMTQPTFGLMARHLAEHCKEVYGGLAAFFWMIRMGMIP